LVNQLDPQEGDCMKSLKLLAATAAATMLVFGTAQAGDAAAGKAKAEACADCHDPADFAGEDAAALTQAIKDVAGGKTKHKSKIDVSDADAADIAAYWAKGG
jgi:cytochrome c553